MLRTIEAATASTESRTVIEPGGSNRLRAGCVGERCHYPLGPLQVDRVTHPTIAAARPVIEELVAFRYTVFGERLPLVLLPERPLRWQRMRWDDFNGR